MAIATVLHFSDIHENGSGQDLDAIVELANSTKPDAAISSGDLVDGQVILDFFAEAEKQVLNLSEEQITLYSTYSPVYITVKQKGEEEIKKQLKDPRVSKEEIGLFKTYFEKKETIDNTIETIAKETENKGQEILKTAMPQLTKYISKLDKGISKIKCPVLGVKGNHDPDLVYKIMKNMIYLEKRPAKIKGLVFAGAPNTNEMISGLPEELYKDLGQDAFVNNIEEFIQRAGSKEDIENFKSNNKVYQKLKKQLQKTKADVLVTHKGLDSFAGNFGYGAGLALWVKEQTVKGKNLINLCGHIHDTPFYSNEHGYEGIRAGAENLGERKSGVARAYVLHIDTETKQITEIDVYKKIYEAIDASKN
ncbi:metallophosphoesterase [Candidatus Woesearchaeota archaeon]|nr:metallophosphoesterase [Candidatus Woesearchaeota archaeon]